MMQQFAIVIMTLGIACASPSQRGQGGHQGGGPVNNAGHQGTQGAHQLPGTPSGGQTVNQEAKSPPKPYLFAYGVNGDKQGGSFGQQEVSDGTTVKGSYIVNLPDGRQQVVSYTADKQNGFQADVSYVGQAKYPAAQIVPNVPVQNNIHTGNQPQGSQQNKVNIQHQGGHINQSPPTGQSAQQTVPHQNHQVQILQPVQQTPLLQPQAKQVVNSHHIQGIVLPQQLHQVIQTHLGQQSGHLIPLTTTNASPHPNQGHATKEETPKHAVYTDEKNQESKGVSHEAQTTNQKPHEGHNVENKDGEVNKGDQDNSPHAEGRAPETHHHGEGQGGGHGGGHGEESEGHGGHRDEDSHGRHGGEGHRGSHHGTHNDEGDGRGQKSEGGQDYGGPDEDYSYGGSDDGHGDDDFFSDHGGFGGFANSDNRLHDDSDASFSDIVYETERDRDFFRNKYSPTRKELKELEWYH